MERCPRRRAKECTLKTRDCGEISHHIFYPSTDYRVAGPIAEEFRDLRINQVPMCKMDEQQLHEENPDGPPMPTMEVMEHCIAMEKLRRELAIRPIRRP